MAKIKDITRKRGELEKQLDFFQGRYAQWLREQESMNKVEEEKRIKKLLEIEEERKAALKKKRGLLAGATATEILHPALGGQDFDYEKAWDTLFHKKLIHETDAQGFDHCLVSVKDLEDFVAWKRSKKN